MYLLKPYGRKGTLLYDSGNGEESRIIVNNREYLESPVWFVLVTTAKYILFSGHRNIDLFTGRKLMDIYGTLNCRIMAKECSAAFSIRNATVPEKQATGPKYPNTLGNYGFPGRTSKICHLSAKSTSGSSTIVSPHKPLVIRKCRINLSNEQI